MNRRRLALLVLVFPALALLAAERTLPPIYPGLAWFSLRRANRYELAGDGQRATFRRVGLPFAAGTPFIISQGPFGWSHSEPGVEYRWDLAVPLGTPVVAVEPGDVLSVFASEEGGCDAKYAALAANVQILQADGTVAQYTHIAPRVAVGDRVDRGSTIATTAHNGFLCGVPHLDFLVYRSKDTRFGSASPESLPLLFDGIAGGIARQGGRYVVR
jgi:murein DD-endopeptidase MepM/ murein hydrolase activator NlpD